MKIDYSVILKQCGGDEALVKEVISILAREAPGYLEKMRQALASDDFKAIAGIAHTLKGSVANFGAAQVSDAVIALEAAAKAGDKNDVTVKLDLAGNSLNELIAALQGIDKSK